MANILNSCNNNYSTAFIVSRRRCPLLLPECNLLAQRRNRPLDEIQSQPNASCPERSENQSVLSAAKWKRFSVEIVSQALALRSGVHRSCLAGRIGQSMHCHAKVRRTMAAALPRKLIIKIVAFDVHAVKISSKLGSITLCECC